MTAAADTKRRLLGNFVVGLAEMTIATVGESGHTGFAVNEDGSTTPVDLSKTPMNALDLIASAVMTGMRMGFAIALLDHDVAADLLAVFDTADGAEPVDELEARAQVVAALVAKIRE